MCVLLRNYVTLAFGNKLSYLFCQFLMSCLLPKNKNTLLFALVTFAGHWSIRGNLTRLVNYHVCFPPLCLFILDTDNVIPHMVFHILLVHNLWCHLEHSCAGRIWKMAAWASYWALSTEKWLCKLSNELSFPTFLPVIVLDQLIISFTWEKTTSNVICFGLILSTVTSPMSTGIPPFFPVIVLDQLIINFAWEKGIGNVISIE